MSKYNPSLIPTRLPISGQVVKDVARVYRDRLLSAWGLMNASKIASAIRADIKAEKMRRKEKE